MWFARASRLAGFLATVALMASLMVVAPGERSTTLWAQQSERDGSAAANGDAAPQGRTFDRTLRLQVQLPPQLYAGVAQPWHCAVQGTRGRSVTLEGSVRAAGQPRRVAERLFEPLTLSSDEVALPRVELPVELVGEVTFEVVARTEEGIQRVKLRERVLAPPLTSTIVTDKPLYQPGQTVHIRSLSFDPLAMQAAADREATVEIRNPQGILVWRNRDETDEYGLLSHTFQLASEVPTGAYEIRISMPPNSATQTFFVREYQLPKFLIDLETDKGFYLPDEEMRINVEATYAFGEPVRDAETEISVLALDPQTQQERGRLARLTGRTDEQGRWRTRLSLPREMEEVFGEASQVALALRVVMTDPGELTEITSEVRRVAREPLSVQLLPENGVLVPGVENRVFVAVSYPDGSPAPASVELERLEKTLETNELGLADFRFTPTGKGEAFFEEGWRIQVTDERGHRPEVRWRYAQQVADGGPTARRGRVRLTARDAVLAADAPLALKIESAPAAEQAEGDALRTLGYTVEVRKLGTTVLAREVVSREAEAAEALLFELPDELVGQLDVVVHELLGHATDAEEAGGVELRANAAAASVYRASADALDVEVSPSAVEFAPGEQGEIHFRATRRSGRPGPVVLGVDIVDTALFGLIPEERERLDLVLLLRRNLFDDALLEHFLDASLSKERRASLFRVLASRQPLHAERVAQHDSTAQAERITRQRLARLGQLIERYRPYFHYRGRYREPLRWLLDNAEQTGLEEEDLYDVWGNRILFVERYGNQRWVLLSPGPSGEIDAEDVRATVNDDNLVN